MNKVDFEKYIASFNKLPGEYTEEEILKICLKHRSLKSGKNWAKLVETLGINKKPNSLRSWALKQFKLMNSECTKEDTELSDYDIIYKEKTQIRDIWNAYRSHLRSDARYNRLLESISNTVDKLNKLPSYVYESKNSTNKNIKAEAVMLLSDLHIGVKCNSFYNTYNIEVGKKRIDKYVQKVIDYCSQNNVYRLNICNLGDAIQGIIHTNARIEAETNAVDQTMIAAEIISEALNKLQKAAPEVIYRSCSDNHSRLMASKDENLESENLGRIIDWYIKLRLKDSRIQFVNDNLDYCIGKFSLMNGKNVIFSHGHQDSKNQAFQNYVGATKEYIDYILLGHYHSGQMKAYQGCKVFINGSVSGTENYALGKRLFSDPEQTLLIFYDSDVIAYNINLNL